MEDATITADIVKGGYLAFDPAGRYIVAATFGGVFLVPLDGGKLRKLPGLESDANVIAVNADGRLVAAGGGMNDEDRRYVRVWNLESGDSRDLHVGKAVTGIDFTPDDDVMFGADGTLYRWNRIDKRPELLAEGIVGELWVYGKIDVSPDGRYVLANRNLFDVTTGKTRPLESHRGGYMTIFDPTGKIIISSGMDGVVRVGPVSGEEPHWLVGHERVINEVAVSADGRWIASVGADGTTRLWPMPDVDKPPLHTLPLEELLDVLRAQTNRKIFRDAERPKGYVLGYEDVALRSWDDVPVW
jgi:WD40 repeat protein